MAIPVQFQQFKSAGIYRVVYDKSTVLGTEAELLRLVVGYSPKGPFNTPVYVKSVSDFKTIFGDISKTLEKRGCFFHRTAIQALNAGPVLCLNLKPFDKESVGALGIGDKFYSESKKVTEIFDRTRFWKLDPDNLNDGQHYIHMSMTDSKETSGSVFIRKAPASKVKEYDITISEWYNNYGEDIPEYLEGHEDMKLSDLFTEVYVFKGEFLPKQIELSPLKKYFRIYEVYEAGKNAVQVKEPEYAGKWFDITTVEDNRDETYSYIAGSIQLIPMFAHTDDGTETIYHPSDVTKLSDGKYYVTSTLVEDPESGELTTDEGSIEVQIREYVGKDNSIVYDKSTGVTEVDGKIYKTDTLSDGTVIQGSKEVKLGDYVMDYDSYDDSYNISFDGENDSYISPVYVYNTITNAFGDEVDALDALYNDSASGAIGHYIGCVLPNFFDNNYGYKSIDILFNNDSDLHHMMMSLDEDMLTENLYDGAIKGNQALVEQYTEGQDNTVLTLSPIYLSGYTYANSKPSDSSISAKYAWQKSILDVLNTETGLLKGLLSPAEIEYRYIVDSFESYYNAGAEMKSQLSLIAKQKELCFALLNFPSVSALMKQAPDIFGKNGIYDVNKVVKNIVLPSENNGASFCAFFTPLKFSDGYVDTIVPSAGLVSNLFIAKYNGLAAYNIIAGPNYGNITYANLVGPDYHYSQDELHVIEPFGVNCMIYRPTFGTFINANQTAKQTPKSALSAINVRELVIYLQDEIGKILQANQWEFNNQTTRDAIKNRADLICEQAKKDGGLQAYLNVMDESNNDADIIDNEMCVLSTSIEPGRGMGKMIHELTIYRTGGMTSTIVEE